VCLTSNYPMRNILTVRKAYVTLVCGLKPSLSASSPCICITIKRLAVKIVSNGMITKQHVTVVDDVVKDMLMPHVIYDAT
jgi:hypothetical protein